MAAPASLPNPGVEIIQELRTATPQILAPTLKPCVMGVCKQIIEPTESDGTINSDALVSGPAVATAPNVQASYNLNGKTLIVSINEGPSQTFSFTGVDPLTAAQAAIAINGATPAPSGFSAYAYEDALGFHLQLRTLTEGESSSIKIIGGTGLSELGWDDLVGWTYYGLGAYRNRSVFIPQSSLPDPRGIIDELDVEEDSIRAFLDLGSEIREIDDDSSFLRKGAGSNIVTNPGAEPFNDLDGDSTTPYLDLKDGAPAAAAVNLMDAPGAATVSGAVDLSTPASVHNKSLVMSLDGSGLQTITFVGQPIMSLDLAAPVWANVQSNDLVLVVNGVTITITFSGVVASVAAFVSEINAAVAAVIGVGTIVAYRADQWGDENAAGTYVGLFFGGAPSTTIWPNTEVKALSSVGGSTIALMTEVFGADANQTQKNTIDKLDPTQPIDDIKAQINALMGAGFASTGATVPDELVMTSSSIGAESKIEINSLSTALVALGLTAGLHYGTPFVARLGDEVYCDGVLLGTITEVHSGGQQGRVKLSSEISLSTNYLSWYIVANNLDNYDPATEWGVIVPTPDLYIDTNGDINIKADFLRDTTGTSIGATPVSLYISYTALRLDVTPDAESPGLLMFDDVDDLEESLGPLTPDNPLGYGLYIALVNAGAVSVYGIGVPETSSDRPYGTAAGWAKVADYLEAKGVWGLAQLTDDPESIQIMRTHVLSMSSPENKGERVLYCYYGRPTREVDTVVSSGTDGDKLSATTFDTKIATLTQALLTAGVDPTNIVYDDHVFIDFAADSKSYNIQGSITNGTEVTINTAFAATENTDAFYATTDLTTLTLISETFSISIRGAVIANTAAGREKEIETITARGQGLGSRRVRMVQCDTLRASVDGVTSAVAGFYMTAAKAGLVAGLPPSQPYTLYPVTGFTGVTGSNDIYKGSQMDQAAGGGAEWIIQETLGAPIVSRHQVTTDLTSVETTEQSITNALDYVSLFIRGGIRNFIGRYNISDTFLDTLASVVQGQLAWLVDKKVIAAGDLINIIQDTDNPTRTLIDITVLPFYPCNYVRITIIV